MTQLSPAQIKFFATAFWSGTDLDEAVAVALAESSGRTDAVSANPDGGQNIGLWQLDTKGGGKGVPVDMLKDPFINAQYAHKMWLADGKTFKVHWQSANDGSAQRYLSTASKAAGAGKTFGSLTGPEATVNTLAGGDKNSLFGQIGTVLQDLSTPAFWGRVALGVVGAALVIAGFVALSKPVTAPVIAAGSKIAKKTTPAGRVSAALG